MKRTVLSIIGIMALAAGSASAELIWSEGFNSDFSNPYAASSWGAPQFGITGPGISTNSLVVGIEGDGLACANSSKTAVNGVASIISGMDISLGTVADAGITYTFSGDFGWRYGSLAAASDLAIHYGQTGFVVGSTVHTAGDFQTFNFGTSTSGDSQLATHDFSYTTVAGDVGQAILVRIRMVDNNSVGTLTQLLADDWQVTAIPEPATLGMIAAFGGGILFIRRRFMI